MQSNEIEYLVKRAKGRDSDAFEKLIHICTKDMYRVALAILMNDEDAADAMQDTILACWEKISTLKQSKYFKTWMTRILINKCYDIRKSREKLTYMEEYQETPLEDNYNLEFKEALSLLSEKYRIVMILFYSQGYKIAEIAEMLHIPQSTVQTRLKRAREKLTDYYRS